MQAHAFLDAPPTDGRLRFVIGASIVVGLLLAAISIGGLALPSVYARETASWQAQAIAQDCFDLAVAAPVLVVAAWWAWSTHGSRRARLVLGGALLYAIYTLLIYAFAVHLNVLFLAYCAALGIALYAGIVLASSLEALAPGRHRFAAGFLVAIGVVFAALWLAQLVPAALTGRVPPELADTGLLTNPVHVIDLSFVLPLHVIAGVLLWRQRPLGDVLAPIVLAFGALMAASIAFLLVFTGGYAIAAAMAAVALASLVLAARLLRA